MVHSMNDSARKKKMMLKILNKVMAELMFWLGRPFYVVASLIKHFPVAYERHNNNITYSDDHLTYILLGRGATLYNTHHGLWFWVSYRSDVNLPGATIRRIPVMTYIWRTGFIGLCSFIEDIIGKHYFTTKAIRRQSFRDWIDRPIQIKFSIGED